MSDPLPHDPEFMEDADRWDADDPRRQKDCFAPPTEPCECYCLHCQRTFMSDQMWLQKIIGDKGGLEGFWMCPTPNCDGKGFTFDIFPTDPTHPANDGWSYDDDEEEYYEEFDDEEDQTEWDPEEKNFKALDERYGDEDDDYEGEEWKFGLQPGDPLPEPSWIIEARRREEEEQRRYDSPDERPREVDWTNREPRNADDGPSFLDEDIPF